MTHKLLIAMGVMASPALMLASTVGDGIRFATNEFKTVKAVNKTRNQSVVRPMRQLDGRQTAAASSRQTIRPISRAASRQAEAAEGARCSKVSKTATRASAPTSPRVGRASPTAAKALSRKPPGVHRPPTVSFSPLLPTASSPSPSVSASRASLRMSVSSPPR